MVPDPASAWLHENAWEGIDPIWKGRIQVMLEDLTGLDHLRFCQVWTGEGQALSRCLGPGGDPAEGLDAGTLRKLHGTVDASFGALGEELPTHIVEETPEGLLFIGFAVGMILVAGFDGEAAQGAVAMRFAKRIRHLRSLRKTRNRGALYV